MAETRKAYERRKRTGFFDKYVDLTRPGIDIGCQRDPLNPVFRRYDLLFGDGDATLMADVPDNCFTTVYASHILEHLSDPALGLQNWWRILAPGGHLIVAVPHRDLYEKKKTLPSRWNGDHKFFYLPDTNEEPCTLSLRWLLDLNCPDGEIVHFEVCDEGWISNGPTKHSGGEYQIEAVVRKPL
jgi:SAM-dependent methyltransferase